MAVRKPHFLLFCDSAVAQKASANSAAPVRCKWRCVLDNLENRDRIEIADSEPELTRERGSLMAVVRGLEALEQPSSVTLVTSSGYVNKGMRYGLKEWRESNYRWEHFGTEKPIRNADLWQRINVAMAFHEVDCRLIESNNNAAVALTESDEELSTDFDVIDIQHQPLARPKRVSTATLLKSVHRKLKSVGHLSLTALRFVLQTPERMVFACEAAFDAFCDAFTGASRMRVANHRNEFHRGIF